MTVQRKSYTSGHFEMSIDGHKTTTYLTKVEGGWAKANTSDEQHGAGPLRVKQLANFEYEPIKIEFGASSGGEVFQWIQDSWKGSKFSTRNGEIVHADFNLDATYQHEFFNSLISEVTFPSLDGSSKEMGIIKCTIVPEGVLTTLKPGRKLQPDARPKQKMWTMSSFRLTLDQLDGLEYTNKIDSFTIKQGVKKHYVGAERFPQIVPTKIEFPTLSCTISLAYADKLLKWHNDYIAKGKVDPTAQLSGALEFLSPDRKQTIFRINLFEVGLASAAIMPSTANADQIKRVKFDLFVNRMEMDGPGALGVS